MANKFCKLTIILLLLVFIIPISLISCNSDDEEVNPDTPEVVVPPYKYQEGSTIYIEMGYYPQTLETEYTVNEIKTGALQESGYYLYNNNLYEILTAKPCTQDMTPYFSNGEVCQDGQEYAFKVEPIVWKIINKVLKEDDYLVYSNKILDTSIFQKQEAFSYYSTYGNYYLYDSDNNLQYDKEIYANNYANSILRLNATAFYAKAFDENNKKGINKTDVVNSSPDYGAYYEPSHQDNTQDYVFALSSAQATNSKYGYTQEDKDRRLREVTDYAVAKGVFCLQKSDEKYYGWTWTRTAADKSNKVYIIDTEGNLDKVFISSDEDYKVGFAPAMRIIIQ